MNRKYITINYNLNVFCFLSWKAWQFKKRFFISFITRVIKKFSVRKYIFVSIWSSIYNDIGYSNVKLAIMIYPLTIFVILIIIQKTLILITWNIPLLLKVLLFMHN